MADVIDNGWYRVQWRETGDSDWNTGLANRAVITATDSTTNWSSASNTTVSTVPNPSEDGTAVKIDLVDTQTTDSRFADYNPPSALSLSGDDYIQFWYQADAVTGDRLLLFDGGGTKETVYFDSQIAAGERTLVQIPLDSFTSINLSNVTTIRWNFGDGTTIDKALYVDSVIAGQAHVPETTTNLAIPYLEDGEEYEVRVRTETEHVQGSWTSPVSIVTKFPAATGLSVSNVTETSADLSWTDEADNEDGYWLQHRRRYDHGWGPWATVVDLAPNTTSATDDTIAPGNDYEWRVQAYTEDEVVTSTTVSATTPSLGLPATHTRSDGWHVEVEHPDGSTRRPTVVGSPERNPRVNDLPRIRVPVAKDDGWSADAWLDRPMRAWYDGVEQPIDSLVDVEQEPGRTVLVGRGGEELLDRVTADFVEEKAHLAAEQLVSDGTSYVANVDAPASTSEEDVVVQSADTDADLSSLVTPAATDPFEVSNGSVNVLQTCWFFEAETEFATGMYVNAAYSGEASTSGENATYFGGVYGSVGDAVSYSFTTDYDVPADHLVVAWRDDANDVDDDGDLDPMPGLRVTLDGTELVHYPDGWSIGGAIGDPSQGDLLGWDEYVASAADGGLSTVSAGSHTLTIETTARNESGYDEWILDCLAVYDDRYGYTFDDDNGNPYTTSVDSYEPGYLAGPEPYPDAVQVEFADAAPTKSVTGGRGEVSVTNTKGKQAVSISNDSGATWETASNATAVEHDWGTVEDTVRLRATLSRYTTGDATTTPSTGDATQSLDSYALKADLQDVPILVNKSYDGRLVDVLREIADYGNFVFEFRREDGTDSVEWTQPGQRAADADAAVVDYSVSKNTSKRVEKAVVFGSARPVDGETFTAQQDAEVQLGTPSMRDDDGNLHVVENSETVRDLDTGTVYDRGADYVMRNGAGTIEVLSTGDMSDATDYEIAYSYKISNSHAANGVTDPTVRRFDLPGIPTMRGCGQAALYVVQKLGDPVIEVELDVAKEPLGWHVVDAVQPPELPTDGRLQIRELSQTPERVRVRLASRESIADLVSDLRDRVGSVARRV